MGAPDPRRRYPAEARLRVARCARAVAVVGAIIASLLIAGASAALAPEADRVEEGRDLYGDICATCHGRDMVAAGGLAFDLRKFPKDDFSRFRNSVLNGKNPAMPAWRDKLSDDDVAALWAYVRSGG